MRLRLALIAVAALAAIAPVPGAMVERYYSNAVFPALQRVVTLFSNVWSIALLDVLLVLVAVWLVFQIIGIFVLRRRFGWISATLRTFANIATAAAIFYLLFLAMWGLNYRRVPISQKVPFDPGRVTPSAVLSLAHTTVDQVNGLYASAHTGESIRSPISPSLASAFADAQRALSVSWRALPGRPKRSILDFYFLRAGVAGMTDPFFLETLVASDLLPFERPQVVAHEWAHLSGFNDEGEANFVGWLTCLRAPDAAKYSGWLFLYGEVTASLAPQERADVAGRLAAGPRDDLRAIAERLRQHVRPFVAYAGWQVYDRYLKANRVDAGVRSYGDVVRLALGVRLE
jgi:Protein of unknown function (DUF3810)